MATDEPEVIRARILKNGAEVLDLMRQQMGVHPMVAREAELAEIEKRLAMERRKFASDMANDERSPWWKFWRAG